MGGRSLWIMIMSGPDDGQEIFLSESNGDGRMEERGTWELSAGRREECDIYIPFDTQVSRRHAMLRIDDCGGIWLLDTGSLNGTFIGDLRIEAATPLKAGELFRLGRTWMRIQPGTDRE